VRARRDLAFAAVLLAGGVAVAAMSLRGEPERARKLKVAQRALGQVAPAELASWIIEGRRDFVVVDLRDDAAYRAAHVRDAVHCGSCHQDAAAGRAAQEGPHFVDLSKKLVVYAADGDAGLELPAIVAKNPRLSVLAGGWEGWRREILAPVAFGGEVDRAEIEAKQRQEAVRAFFAGERPAARAVAPLPIAPIKRDHAHKPAGRAEGC
jgi:rhodanese-related sulfurtransferase